MTTSTAEMSETTTACPAPHPTIPDPYQYLQITPNPDGTITRGKTKYPCISPTSDPVNDTPVLSKDVIINQSNNVWARIFIPRQALSSNSKLPLVIYFHGGGFVLASAASTPFHLFCFDMAMDLSTVIVSIEYRLAPEHRLPAAYDDAMDALRWMKTTPDIWLKEHANFSNCCLMGTSAGANMAYHVGLRAVAETEDLEPLKIKGLILYHAYFGGTQRTRSELRLVHDSTLPTCVSDIMWDLSLPHDSDRDHEYCNPTVGGGSYLLEKIRQLGWKVMMIGYHGDPLIDRQIELAKMLEQKGVQLLSHFFEGGCHANEIVNASKSKDTFEILRNFIL